MKREGGREGRKKRVRGRKKGEREGGKEIVRGVTDLSYSILALC